MNRREFFGALAVAPAAASKGQDMTDYVYVTIQVDRVTDHYRGTVKLDRMKGTKGPNAESKP